MSGNCCSPNGTCHTSDAPAAGAQTTAVAVADGVTTTYKVEGVGSAHCQGVVNNALGGLDTVLVADAGIGTGLVTVTTDGEPDDALIARTIEDAGYGFAGRA
ncbi:heavy-metal-associated domain-containing protein [Streptomyces sp. NPDC051940]|uniref:heavy-metal-associated domain-containing protein n=1 Tax=Streptomyces sp. NPDC051940 TaxID=3155675 RepID=UPI0034419B59